MTMTKNTSIILGEHFDKFVTSKVKSGRYGSVSEIVREGLRRIEEDEKKLKYLRSRLELGEQQIKEGKVVKYLSFDDLMDKIDKRVAVKNS